jgi:hypothetical protein
MKFALDWLNSQFLGHEIGGGNGEEEIDQIVNI